MDSARELRLQIFAEGHKARELRLQILAEGHKAAVNTFLKGIGLLFSIVLVMLLLKSLQ